VLKTAIVSPCGCERERQQLSQWSEPSCWEVKEVKDSSTALPLPYRELKASCHQQQGSVKLERKRRLRGIKFSVSERTINTTSSSDVEFDDEAVEWRTCS